MPQTLRTPLQSLPTNISPTHYGSDPDINKDYLDNTDREEILNITKRYKRKFLQTPGTSDSLIGNKIEELRTSQENRFDILTGAITALLEQNNEIKKNRRIYVH